MPSAVMTLQQGPLAEHIFESLIIDITNNKTCMSASLKISIGMPCVKPRLIQQCVPASKGFIKVDEIHRACLGVTMLHAFVHVLVYVVHHICFCTIKVL